jgi:carbamoyltransferase
VAVKILGISAYYHDSAAAIVIDGEIVAAAQEERFTRVKHTAGFPVNAIKFCLEYAGCSVTDLDAVAFYDKPLLKFERLLETYYAFAPVGFRSFLKAVPAWIREKLFLKKVILDGLNSIQEIKGKKIRILFPEHHISHAASAFYPSPFNESAILTIDGVGEWATASIGHGKDSGLLLLKEMRFPHSAGLLYSAFTHYLGFRVNSGEYKLMGLAPYGNPDSPQTLKFIEIIKKNLVDIKNDGSIWLNQFYFDYAAGLRMVKERRWNRLFGTRRRKPDDLIAQEHCNLGYAIQHVTEEIVLRMAEEARRLTNSENLCLAGGVALNCVANGKLREAGIFRKIYVQPAAGDAGGAPGAALASYYLSFEGKRHCDGINDSMKGALLGPAYSDEDILKTLEKLEAKFTQIENYGELCRQTASIIDEGRVVGWFRGRMEFGPRALGNRSILADARNEEMQKKLNIKIKFREGFRPFAPAVMIEDINEFFENAQPSPYMLFNYNVEKGRRIKLPEDYHALPFMDKLYCRRSDIQAVTHLDFSARIQTVHREQNPDFHELLNAFKSLTGYGLLINTSFNVRGEPIVCTPEDAYRCFMATEMDCLVMNNFVLKKEEQPDFKNHEKWSSKFKPD